MLSHPVQGKSHIFSTPNPAWLGFVRTGRARSKIRNYLKTLAQAESERLGEKLLSQALRAEGVRKLPGSEADDRAVAHARSSNGIYQLSTERDLAAVRLIDEFPSQLEELTNLFFFFEELREAAVRAILSGESSPALATGAL